MLGTRLRTLRKRANMTIREFGEEFQLAESTISGYENGIRHPDLSVLCKIADFYGTTVDYLLGRTDSPQTTPSVDASYAELYEVFELVIGTRTLEEICRSSIEQQTKLGKIIKSIWEIETEGTP